MKKVFSNKIYSALFLSISILAQAAEPQQQRSFVRTAASKTWSAVSTVARWAYTYPVEVGVLAIPLLVESKQARISTLIGYTLGYAYWKYSRASQKAYNEMKNAVTEACSITAKDTTELGPEALLFPVARESYTVCNKPRSNYPDLNGVPIALVGVDLPLLQQSASDAYRKQHNQQIQGAIALLDTYKELNELYQTIATPLYGDAQRDLLAVSVDYTQRDVDCKMLHAAYSFNLYKAKELHTTAEGRFLVKTCFEQWNQQKAVSEAAIENIYKVLYAALL